jgi:hypothetical protein
MAKKVKVNEDPEKAALHESESTEEQGVTGTDSNLGEGEGQSAAAPVVLPTGYDALVAAAKAVLLSVHKHTYGSSVAEVSVDALDLLTKALAS